MNRAFLYVLIFLLSVGVIVLVFNRESPPQSTEEVSIPSDCEPFTEVQEAVKGREPKDLTGLKLEFPYGTKKVENLPAFLKDLIVEGLQEAIQTKIRCGNRTTRIVLHWKDDSDSGPFYFSADPDYGWKHAFSKRFAAAVNLLLEPDRERIDLGL